MFGRGYTINMKLAATCFACTCAAMSRATVVECLVEPEHKTLSRLVTAGTMSLAIRAIAITDTRVVKAIRIASDRGLKVRIIVNHVTPELSGLLTTTSIDIRQSDSFSEPLLSNGALSSMVIDEKIVWYGAPIWSELDWVSASTVVWCSTGPIYSDRPTQLINAFERLWSASQKSR